ncbi:MAG: phosphoserine transaminase [Rhodospirillales bacterium]|jgi:phosphoserine aminotransferase|nr:phosphoserine transaminase [Rhodospirillales bacterium]
MKKPANPCFSSGPCAKRPGWSVNVLKGIPKGRSHRSAIGKAKLAEVLDLSRSILKLPDDWRIGIVPASDTGAVEMALWSLLGTRGVEMLAWESFGSGWVSDVQKQLKLNDVIVRDAAYGDIPDLSQVDFDRDVVFTWNGTTSGARVPNGDWIADDRAGLTICDATSAAFAMDLPWDKLDVVTYSWQKIMGGEGAHGILILSPRAVERLESHTPDWPMPKIFRLTKGGKLIEGVFKGETINTPSMLAVEDCIDGLKWAQNVGGLEGLIERTNRNAEAVDAWVSKTPWVEHLATSADIRSTTSMCLKIVDPRVADKPEDDQRALVKKMVNLLDTEDVAYDIGGYRDAPPGLRLWAGATVETSDLEDLFPWLGWAFEQVIS